MGADGLGGFCRKRKRKRQAQAASPTPAPVPESHTCLMGVQFVECVAGHVLEWTSVAWSPERYAPLGCFVRIRCDFKAHVAASREPIGQRFVALCED